ncbi:hypothetical protein X801_01241 [Opisthorchis viverrini]|uniref:Uncharacterized protein n=1 Tax=Opisthorchis viverrini TaxID=6198 RepID=A0A1S8X856_OPIVI|nr:hypothetical protein X801_01241 [Opisthorchis viverrini]
MGSLNGKRSSPSPIRKQGRGRPRKLPETQGTDHSCAASTGALSSVASGDQSHRRLVALPTVPVKSSNQCAAGADATVTNTSMPFTGPGITDSDDGTSSPSDEQSTYSISSLCSPPVPCERDLSYTSDQRCLTPSTLPYTHSSAMEDSAPEETMWTPPGAPNRIHDEPDNAQNDNPSSLDQSSDVDSSCSELCLASKLSPLSSISTAFSAGEDPDAGSADNDSDVEQIHNDDLVTAASVLAQFTARLGKILRRVEELDLLKLAYDINMRKTKVAAGGDEFENEIKCADLVPDAVRLSRHELNVLYTESAQVRLAGSMYTIPTGRLVRFLTLILVNMQAGAHASLLPLSPDEVVLYLEGRNRQRYEGGRRTLADQISESVLWSNPEWSAVLVGLDSARIALNIIAAPDMPRPLLMEDLVEGIVSIVRHVLDGVVCKLPGKVILLLYDMYSQTSRLFLDI